MGTIMVPSFEITFDQEDSLLICIVSIRCCHMSQLMNLSPGQHGFMSVEKDLHLIITQFFMMEGVIMGTLENVAEVDLHDKRLFDAELNICDAIEEAWYCGKECLLLIHGYNNGVAIRNYIRINGGLRKQLIRNYPELPDIRVIPKDHGSTYVKFLGKRKGD